ncbi:MAG: HAMP domain-containing histidine kinase [Oscillospiraceae bacterium]|jgi:signal transduction histidine kinase|nr:HAMP domain-containing histidine kinase [Oscillospiraceae bacterium]
MFVLSSFLLAQAFWVFMYAQSYFRVSNGRYAHYTLRDVISSEVYTDTRSFPNQYGVVLNELDSVARLVGWLGELEKGAQLPKDHNGNTPADYYGHEWTRNMIERDLNQTVNLLNSRNGVVYYCAVAELGVVYSNPTGVPVDWIMSFTHSYRSSPGRVMALTDEYVSLLNSDFTIFRDEMLDCVQQIALFMSLYIVCSTYLVMNAGRRPDDDRIYLNAADKLYTEFTLALVLLAPAGALAVISAFYPITELDSTPRTFVVAICSVIFLAAGIPSMSVVRRAKDKTLLSHTLLNKLFMSIAGLVQRIYAATPQVRRISFAVIALGVLTMIPFAGVITVPIAVSLATRVLTRLNNEQRRILNAEMERRLRAEQLRTELISNVSHDIRTPLTSVITYVDLLKKDGAFGDSAREYIDVIESKAHRLRELTDDLFEASKAASGNIPVTLEPLDLNALTTQGLGEMDAKIQESGLEFRVTLSPEPLIVSADGKLLWRVVENQLSNVFKYALPGSRVYIETSDGGDIATLAIKNVSAAPLNIPADELLERFKRGDDARAGEGSGLGLSISKSLSEAMGGQFYIAVDGDLFKATVSLPKGEMPPCEDASPPEY